jgi:hypothetical protein
MAHYLKAKYEVSLYGSSKLSHIMFQRDDDRFRFIKKEDVERNFNINSGFHDINSGWNADALQHVKDALAGKLTPIYENKLSSPKPLQETNTLCSCPYENYSIAGGFIGCTCGATKNGKG